MPQQYPKLQIAAFILAMLSLTGFADAAIDTQATSHNAVHHPGKSGNHRNTHHTNTAKPKINIHKAATHKTLRNTHKASHQHLNKHAATHKIKQSSRHAHKTNPHHKHSVAQHHNVSHVSTHSAIAAAPRTNIKGNAFATPKTMAMLNTNQNTGQRLVSFVHEVVASLRYSTYRSGGETFDSRYGIYKVDCSHYVDNILRDVSPRAYASLVSSTGAQTPDTANYYDFFTRLSSNLRYDWDKVDNAKDLQPGDVLVFRYRSASGAPEGGHVMLVMDKPILDNDALLVRVSDSASSGHSDDTRPAHNSGVGIGTLLLKVNSNTGQPSAYAWELNSPWQRVNVAMARPQNVG